LGQAVWTLWTALRRCTRSCGWNTAASFTIPTKAVTLNSYQRPRSLTKTPPPARLPSILPTFSVLILPLPFALLTVAQHLLPCALQASRTPTATTSRQPLPIHRFILPPRAAHYAAFFFRAPPLRAHKWPMAAWTTSLARGRRAAARAQHLVLRRLPRARGSYSPPPSACLH